MSTSDLAFSIFGRNIRISCEDEQLRQLILINYQAFETSFDTADIDYSVGRNSSGGFCIARGEELPVDEDSAAELRYRFIYSLEKLITIDVQLLRGDLYFVHSSAMARDGRATMFIAESGTGKSTTAWALLQHGFDYLSDELAAIDLENRTVFPYPHALCLKTVPPGPYPLPAATFKTERTLHIPVSALNSSVVKTPRPLQGLIFLTRDQQRDTPGVQRISPAEAGARLYANTLNALAHAGSGLNAAVSISAGVPAYVLSMGELRPTCEMIAELQESMALESITPK